MLIARDIEKSFGPTRVLSGANLALNAGEIHALLGANGAGKSTLSRILTGQIARDGGTISFKNKEVVLASPRDALHVGVSIVMQETSLAPDLSVLDNIFLPSFAMPGRISGKQMRKKADAILTRLGQKGAISVDASAGSLSAAQRQLVEIAKALAFDAAVIIFDEPTAALSPPEVERLFGVMEQLRDDGHAIGFVSHRLEEVLTLTDKVSVLRDGRSVAESIPTKTLTQAELIRLMVGHELGEVYGTRRTPKHIDSPVTLRVDRLASTPEVRNVSFTLHKGEILGLGGLVGSGRSETVEAIVGLRPITSGTITLDEKPFAPRNPAEALRSGIALVPEDRRRQSIIPDFSVFENLHLGNLGASRGIGLGYGALKQKVDELLVLMDIPNKRLKNPSLLNFSGGMQQKIIIARWLLLEPDILILDEPTKGIDIATRSSIYRMLQQIADQGVSILVISSDFEELLGICERVVVVSDGTTIADIPSLYLTEEHLTLLAAPRTSMANTQKCLHTLADEFSCYSFWGMVDHDRLVCLAEGKRDGALSTDLSAGTIVPVGQTSIGTALAGPRGVWVATSSQSKAIVVDVKTSRGDSNGIIGLIIPSGATPPPEAFISARVTAAFAQAGA
jgi:ABC-type sugar transport system ATPase subunit